MEIYIINSFNKEVKFERNYSSYFASFMREDCLWIDNGQKMMLTVSY